MARSKMVAGQLGERTRLGGQRLLDNLDGLGNRAGTGSQLMSHEPLGPFWTMASWTLEPLDQWAQGPMDPRGQWLMGTWDLGPIVHQRAGKDLVPCDQGPPIPGGRQAVEVFHQLWASVE